MLNIIENLLKMSDYHYKIYIRISDILKILGPLPLKIVLPASPRTDVERASRSGNPGRYWCLAIKHDI
jgi:hypothetical protein